MMYPQVIQNQKDFPVLLARPQDRKAMSLFAFSAPE
jgi:hypothetical protein